MARLRFIFAAVVIVIIAMLIMHVDNLNSRISLLEWQNAELKMFIVEDLAAAREHLEQTEDRVDALWLRITGGGWRND